MNDHIHHAIASFHDGDANSCAAALQEALALDPYQADALRLTADLDSTEGRYDDAIKKYETIAEAPALLKHIKLSIIESSFINLLFIPFFSKLYSPET